MKNIETMPVSKVLVLDGSNECYDHLRQLCKINHLIGFKVNGDNVLSVLQSNIDLGGILLSETSPGESRADFALARKIKHARPELPIFLRREHKTMLDDLPEYNRNLFVTAFTINDTRNLQKAINERIFSLRYPNALVRGIIELTKTALETQFRDMTVHAETPCIVHDRLIFGEIYTMMPIESHWCRGYMMLQAEESPLMQLVRSNRTRVNASSVGDFRNLNNLLGEISNLIWGSFKNRFVNLSSGFTGTTQVPIIINHEQRYISFGSEEPQLCFKYSLIDNNGSPATTLNIFQRFIFNLDWSPEAFSENSFAVDALIQSGEIELF